MKKIFLFCLTLFCVSCTSQTKTELSSEANIWIITDIHYLSPSLHDDGSAFQNMQSTGAGKDLVYAKERMEALIEQAKIEKPALLIVSGDLTFNGELQSFIELADFFKTIEANGTPVLVIPGNHDISSGWARSFQGEQQVVADQILPNQFVKLFNAFGFQESIAKDSHSLSYVAQPYTNVRFLMIDSNIYSQSKSTTAPPTNGQLKKETLEWIEKQLIQAKNDNVLIVPVMHHNVLAHHQMLSKGYQLDNAADLMQLYEKYQIKASFSGHIHTQSIKTQDLGNIPHTEIVTEAFSLTPGPIGTFTIQDDQLNYQFKTLDFSYYIQNYQPTNPDLLDHKSYLSKVFYNSNYQLVHDSLYSQSIYSIELGNQLVDIISPLNEHFFSGELLTQDYLDTHVYNQDAYQQLLTYDANTFLIRYINRSINARLNQSMREVSIPIK